MATDVEMNDVRSPLMNETELDKVPEVDFKSSKQNIDKTSKDEEFRGLTKEELEKFAKDPFWRKLRLILFVLFWVVWAAMLIAAILIVVFSKKCPKRPKLEFWEQKTGYWIDPFAFVDTDDNNVGDFKGIMKKLDYIQTQVGAGYIILDPIFKGQYSNDFHKIGLTDSFRDTDPILGSMESFKELIKESRKRGMEIVLSADFNALSINSEFVKANKESVLIPYDSISSWVNRNGDKTFIDIDGKKYYSGLKSRKMVELNLKNELVLKEIGESIKLWLNIGVRGFLLTNIGMYVENVTNSINHVNNSCGNESNTDWYRKQYFNGQIFTSDTQGFLKEIRKTMDEVAKSSDKSRLLIVDAGDVGIGLSDDDQLLQYLGKKENLADMIIGREFLGTRGWKVNCSKSSSSINNYLKMVPPEKRKMVGLTSATSSSLRSTDLLKMVSPFLLEGNSILYYGSEIGISCDVMNSSNSVVYPGNKTFVEVKNEFSVKCNHLVMPWDNTGEGFHNGNSNKTSEYFSQSKNTVQSLTAAGIGENILQLHKKLIKLRKEPSLLWGKTKEIINKKNDKYSYEIFTRQAEGFPIFVVALLKDSVNDGKVFSFKSICEKFTPVLVYPFNANLKENVEVDTKSIFLKIGNTESLHVFKCVE